MCCSVRMVRVFSGVTASSTLHNSHRVTKVVKIHVQECRLFTLPLITVVLLLFFFLIVVATRTARSDKEF